jgi:uncharacterized protein YajQ (UPF0234 family)
VVVWVAKWVVGTAIVGPKCGKPGKVGRDKFTWKGRVYYYWTVRHYENGRVRRCIIQRAEGGAPVVEIPRAESQVPAGPKAAAEAAGVEEEGEGEVAAAAPVEVPAFEEAPEWERRAWHYIVKVNASWGSFRENPTEENFRTFVNTVQKTAWRVGVPCHYVIVAAENFFRAKSGVAKGAVNNAMQHFSYAIREAMKKRAEGTETAVQAAPVAPQPVSDVKEIGEVVREEVERAVNAVMSEIASRMMEKEEVEVPKEVVESIQVVRDQIATIQRELDYVKEQVRQRKGVGARAIARGEKRIEFKEGGMYWMIREVMRQGGEWTKEQIVDEIRKRFGKVVSGNSVSGRISEMAAAGFVVGRREGRTWYWRWVGP